MNVKIHKILASVFAFIVFFHFQGSAQERIIPGYLGKKNILFASGKICALPLYNYFVVDYGTSFFKSNILLWNAGVKRVIGKSGTVGLSAGYAQGTVFSDGTPEFVSCNYSGLDFKLDFRSYSFRNRGSLAPLGKHMRYNILYSEYAIHTAQDRLQLGKIRTIGAGLGLGSSRIFYDKLWVDYGWDFDLTFKVYDQQDIVNGFKYDQRLFNITQTMFIVTFNASFGLVY